jgi:hypothetical protein
MGLKRTVSDGAEIRGVRDIIGGSSGSNFDCGGERCRSAGKRDAFGGDKNEEASGGADIEWRDFLTEPLFRAL